MFDQFFFLQIQQHTAECLECGKRTAQLLLTPQQRDAIGRRHHLKFITGHYGSGKVSHCNYQGGHPEKNVPSLWTLSVQTICVHLSKRRMCVTLHYGSIFEDNSPVYDTGE